MTTVPSSMPAALDCTTGILVPSIEARAVHHLFADDFRCCRIPFYQHLTYCPTVLLSRRLRRRRVAEPELIAVFALSCGCLRENFRQAVKTRSTSKSGSNKVSS